MFLLPDVLQAIQRGARYSEKAFQLSFEERERALLLLQNFLMENIDQLAVMEGQATTFPASAIKDRDLAGVLMFLRETIQTFRARYHFILDRKFHPTGLVSATLPATGGLAFGLFALVSALASGCPLLLKISSRTPGSLQVWNLILNELGLDPAHLQVFVAVGKDVGRALVSHPSVRGVIFAGRPENAQMIRAFATQEIRKLQIHGGVKNSLIVLKGADLSPQSAIWSSLVLGAGRSPWCLSQAYVVESMYPEFIQKAEDFLLTLPPLEPVMTPGLLVSDNEKLISQLQSEGGRWVVHPEKHEGSGWLRPALMKDLTHCSPAQLEEVRLPLILASSVKYAHEAVKWTNLPEYSFVASVWGEPESVEKIASNVTMPCVWKNSWWPQTRPLFGWKKSFFGSVGAYWFDGFWSFSR